MSTGKSAKKNVTPAALDKEYGGQLSVTGILYPAPSTSAFDHQVLSKLSGNASRAERQKVVLEASRSYTLEVLREAFRHVQQKESHRPIRVLEGGFGRGQSFSLYREVVNRPFRVVGVELSNTQYAASREYIERLIADPKSGVAPHEVLFTDVENFFSTTAEYTPQQLIDAYKYILLKGDVFEFITKAAKAGIEFDLAVFVESIIHMDRQDVIAATEQILAKGGILSATDVGVWKWVAGVSTAVEGLLNQRAGVASKGEEWWQKNYGDRIVSIVNHDKDMRATAHHLFKELRDPQVYQQCLNEMMKAGRTESEAKRQLMLDMALFLFGGMIVTNYQVSLKKG